MFIRYNESELLELFENEPVAVAEPDAGMFIYSKTDTLGFKLVLTISVYEKECVLSLSYQSYSRPIIDLTLQNVTQMIGDSSKLIIKSDDTVKSESVKYFV